MAKEELVTILEKKGYKCIMEDAVPTVYLTNYSPDEIKYVKSTINEYVGSIAFKPMKEAIEKGIEE